ncbi:hypothetical protein DC094_15260 [Pelagibaculum spongiae]|uniref:Uncharacterized protein n=1 Tax=Pelagibaculum spongiae TaxID=2080658 RepID=A0A2V1GRS5_9GAMM|nr:hypothetical protein DC094_15260 [Pelagibaculum spongiae]
MVAYFFLRGAATGSEERMTSIALAGEDLLGAAVGGAEPGLFRGVGVGGAVAEWRLGVGVGGEILRRGAGDGGADAGRLLVGVGLGITLPSFST